MCTLRYEPKSSRAALVPTSLFTMTKSSPPSPAMLATAHAAWPWTLTTRVAHCRECALQNRKVGEHETRRLAQMTYNLPVGRERHADVSAKLEICLAKLSGRPGERYAPRNRVVAVATPPSCPYTRGSWPYEDEVRAPERRQSGHRTARCVDLQPTRTAGGLRRTPASPGSPPARPSPVYWDSSAPTQQFAPAIFTWHEEAVTVSAGGSSRPHRWY